jgi:hypothetical protein
LSVVEQGKHIPGNSEWAMVTLAFLALLSVQGIQAAGARKPWLTCCGQCSHVGRRCSIWSMVAITGLGQQLLLKLTCVISGWGNQIAGNDDRSCMCCKVVRFADNLQLCHIYRL